MSLEKSEALVLRVIPFRDTSKIIAVYTEDRGLVSLLAKGVRAARPRHGAALELFAVIDVVYYRRESRELQLLSQAMLLEAHLGLCADPRRYAYGVAVLEFLLRVLSGQEPPGRLYSLTRRTLEVLEEAPSPALACVFRAFQLKAAAFLGHRPELYACVECGRELGPSDGEPLFSPLRGGTVCGGCAGGEEGPAAGARGTVPALRRLLTGTLADLVVDPPDAQALETMGRVLEAFLAAHQTGYQPLRALRMADRLPEAPVR
jgi:DNA repair protein RecO (recombination protein O)